MEGARKMNNSPLPSENLLGSLAVSLWYDVFSKSVALHPVAVLAPSPVQLYRGPYSELIWLQQNFLG